MGRGIVSSLASTVAVIASAVLLSVAGSSSALAVASNPTLGSFDPAAPAANPYAGCVASVLTGSGFVFGSQAALTAALNAVWPNLPPAVASVCKQAVDTRQPQVCVAPTAPAPCSGIGPAAVRELAARVASLPGNWKLVRDTLGCCGGYAETSLVSPTSGTPMAMVNGTFSLPKDFCPTSWCAGKPGLWASCDVFGCNEVKELGVSFVGRTPEVPGVRAHYYTTDGFKNAIYNIDGLYGQGYWGTGCTTPSPSECGFSPAMSWTCHAGIDPAPPATSAPANCGGQSLSISMVFLSGPGGCIGCMSISPTVAQQVSFRLDSNVLGWRGNPTVCATTVDCLRFDDPRLSYLDGAGRPTVVWNASTPVPAAVVNVTSGNLACLVNVNVSRGPAVSCVDVAGTVGPIVQAAHAPVVFATPPTVSATAAPAANTSGFTRGPVVVSISAVSPLGPGVRSINYRVSGAQPIPPTSIPGQNGQVSINTDGQSDVEYFATDLAGSTSPTLHAMVKVDNSPPTFNCATPGAGWHLDNVTVACTASDALSGLDNPAQASFTLTTNVAPGTETASASTDSVTICDRVGNCAIAGPLTGIKIDRAAPTISIRTPSGTYTVGQVALADYSCTDLGSGVTSCAGPVANGSPIDTAAPGPHTFTVSAVDAVGNHSQAVMNYMVVARTCDQHGEWVADDDCDLDHEDAVHSAPAATRAPEDAVKPAGLRD